MHIRSGTPRLYYTRFRPRLYTTLRPQVPLASFGRVGASGTVQYERIVSRSLSTAHVAVRPVAVQSRSLQHPAGLQVAGLAETKFYTGNLRTASLIVLQNILFLVRIAKWKIVYEQTKKFTRKVQLPYLTRVPEGDISASLTTIVDEIFPSSDTPHAALRSTALNLIQQLVEAKTSSSIFKTLGDAGKLGDDSVKALGASKFWPLSDFALPTTSPGLDPPPSNSKSHFTFSLKGSPPELAVSWDATKYGDDFLKATGAVAQALRDENQNPPFADFVAFNLGYQLLNQGHNPFNAFNARFLGTVGFRKDTQTYLSLTDPGEGHIFGTTRKSDWMRGTIVHVEHLERPKNPNNPGPNNPSRKDIESYRIPTLLDFARVHLHTGKEAPNTCFVGRRLKDSDKFGYDFIKVVDTTSAAATALFQLGAAECKVAMDGLTTSQMVYYMRALAGHALRNHKQYLSAAFNLNTPMIDDLDLDAKKQPKVLTDRMDIGRRGIEIAALGGFDKCTWDGASDTYPSIPFMDQIGFANALELVHKAHSVGLTTYFSAGFKYAQIPDAVYAGVDGIGIGGAQILRYMDDETGMHGPYLEENIDEIIKTRDTAANSTRGQGVHLLSRLDQMYFEGSLDDQENTLRTTLYDALYKKDETSIKTILDKSEAKAVKGLVDDGEQPWLGRANRLVRHDSPYLKKGAGSDNNLWNDFVGNLKNLVNSKDELGLYAYSLCDPWKSLRQKYRNAVKDEASHQGEIRVALKTTPYSEV